MSILVATATLLEIAPLIGRRTLSSQAETIGAPGTVIRLEGFDVLVTGVGAFACAAHVSRLLATERYDFVVQAGIAGSFSTDLPKLSVVRVVSEVCADLGAENNGGFLHITDMGLSGPNQAPYVEGELRAPSIEVSALLPLTPVRSITVNRVLSEEGSIKWVGQRFDPQVVNMEGSGFFYSALIAGVPFCSIRSISDMVGPRDKSTWDIPGAVDALDLVLEKVIVEIG